MQQTYYRHSKGALIVYDVTDAQTFNRAKEWQIEIRKYLPEVPIIIAGNKCDIVNHEVDEDMANRYAYSLGADHMLTSAKSVHNVAEVFQKLA